MKEDILEVSLKDLEKLVQRTKRFGLNPVVIGGYAVRAYTRGYRYTKDIDLVILKKELGRLIALLKSLGYTIKETKFGLSGNKKLNGGFIDLHISFGDVWDISTNNKYPVDEILKGSKRMKISGFFEAGRKIKIKISVASLEDLLILKLMTKGREKDVVDSISLIIDRWDELNLENFSSKCSKAKLSKHIRERILRLIGFIRSGKARKIWLYVTGQRLMRKTEMDLIKHLRKMESVVK